MIALPSISQTRSIVEGDTLTCYTNKENREIALIMLEGERDKELLDNCDSTINVLTSELKALKEKDKSSAKMLKDVYVDYNACYFDNSELTRDNKRLKRNFAVSLGINVLIGLIIIL